MKFNKLNMLVYIILIHFSYIFTMGMETVATHGDSPKRDIEMGIVQETVPPQELRRSQHLLIEEPRAVHACCISKHALLVALQGACITGIIFTKDMPILPIFIGLGEGLLLGTQIYQAYDDYTSVPNSKSTHATFSENLHKQGTLQSLRTDNRPIPFNVIDSVEYALTKGKKSVVDSIIHDDTITPILLKLTKNEREDRKQKIVTLLLCLKKNTVTLPKDLGYTLLSYIPELICSKQVFSKVLNYAPKANFNKLCTNCPLSWFNYQYHTMHNTKGKEAFAHTAASTMAQSEVAYKQALFASSNKGIYEIPDKDALTSEYYDRYRTEIIAPQYNKEHALVIRK